MVLFEGGASLDSGEGGGEPGAELTQVVLDVLDRGRAQAERDLGDVAAGDPGERRCHGGPPAHRDRLAPQRASEAVEPPGVEERELQAVEVRGHPAPDCGSLRAA